MNPKGAIPMVRYALIAAALTCLSTSAIASSSAELLQMCDGPFANAEERVVKQAKCLGFLEATLATHHAVISILQEEGVSAHRLICEPDGNTYLRLKQVTIEWLKRHPQFNDLPASASAIQALIEAFPCKK